MDSRKFSRVLYPSIKHSPRGGAVIAVGLLAGGQMVAVQTFRPTGQILTKQPKDRQNYCGCRPTSFPNCWWMIISTSQLLLTECTIRNSPNHQKEQDDSHLCTPFPEKKYYGSAGSTQWSRKVTRSSYSLITRRR